MTARDDGDDDGGNEVPEEVDDKARGFDFDRRTAPADAPVDQPVDAPASDRSVATVPASPRATPRSRPTRSSVEPSAFDPPPERFAERRELGRGGMGRVVEAYDVALGRPVALKQMLSDGVTDQARFEREARITARLEHPGIVPIHDAGRMPDGTPYYVMRRVDGEPLDREVARRRTFAERISLVPNVLAACDAVGFAHARGVIHRDLKPPNILVGPFGETLVIDWGIARVIDEAHDPDGDRTSGAALTRIGSVAGTPGFMAPEQARAETLDARADVYALGATLFFVLAGAPPFSGDKATELIDRAGAERPPEWHRLPAETPPELRAILEKAMLPQRDGRYADGTALAVDLRRYVTGQLVGAYDYSAWEQVRRFVKRHRAAVAITTIALIVIAIGSTIFVRRIVAERDTANEARDRAELAKRDAIDRSDQLIVQSAQQLAARDPAAAIAKLRTLAPDSRQWRRAWVAASAANARGIAFGFSNVPRGPIRTSPDSRYVVASGFPAWHLEVFDLKERRRLTVPAPAPDVRIRITTWLDSAHVVAFTAARVYVIALDGKVRALPLSAEHDWASHADAGRLWIVDKARRAYALDTTTTSLESLVIDDVDRIYPVGVDRAILRRGTTIAMWSSGAITPIAEGVVDHVVAHRRLVTKTARGQICWWTTAAPPVQMGCVQEDPLAEIVAPQENGVVTSLRTASSIAAHLWTGQKVRVIRDRFARASAMGALLDTEDEITTVDMTRTFVVRHGYGDTNYLDQTADGRFLVGTTQARELVVWDLTTFRPTHIGGGMGYQVFHATETATWRSVHLQHVWRHDRVTGKDEEITSAPTADLMIATVDPTETWVGLGIEVGRVIIYTLLHRPSRTLLVQHAGSYANYDGGRLFRVDKDGAITELSPAPTPITKLELGGEPSLLTVRGDWLATGTAAGRTCRVHLPTRASRCIELGPLTAVNLATTGVVYYTTDREVHAWGLDDVRAPLAADVRIGELHWTGTHMVGITTDGIVFLDGTSRSVATPKLGKVHVLTNDRLLATTMDDSLIVIDLIAESWFRASSAPPAMQPHGAGRRLVFFSGGWYELDLVVPEEPAALRAWLDTVTNARVVAGSDVVQWP